MCVCVCVCVSTNFLPGSRQQLLTQIDLDTR